MDLSYLNVDMMLEEVLDNLHKQSTRHPLPDRPTAKAKVSNSTTSTAVNTLHTNVGNVKPVGSAMGVALENDTPEDVTPKDAAPNGTPAAAPTPAPLPALTSHVSHHPAATSLSTFPSKNYDEERDRGIITGLFIAKRTIVDGMKNTEKGYALPGKEPCSSKYPGDIRAAKRAPPATWICYLILAIIPQGRATTNSMVAMIKELYPEADYKRQTVRAALCRGREFANFDGAWTLLGDGQEPPEKRASPNNPKIKPGEEAVKQDNKAKPESAPAARRSERKRNANPPTHQDNDEEYDDELGETEPANKRQRTTEQLSAKKELTAKTAKLISEKNKPLGDKNATTDYSSSDNKPIQDGAVRKSRSGRVIKKTAKASPNFPNISRNSGQGEPKAFQVTTDDEDEEFDTSVRGGPGVTLGKVEIVHCIPISKLKIWQDVSRTSNGTNTGTGTLWGMTTQTGFWELTIGNGPWTLPQGFTEKWIPLQIQSPPAHTGTSTPWKTSGKPKEQNAGQFQRAPKPIGVEVLTNMRVVSLHHFISSSHELTMCQECCPNRLVKLRLYRPEDHAIDISAVCCEDCMMDIALHIETRCAVLGFRDLMPEGRVRVLDNFDFDYNETNCSRKDKSMQDGAEREFIQLTRVGNKFIWARIEHDEAVSVSMQTYAKTWNMRWSRTLLDWVKIES